MKSFRSWIVENSVPSNSCSGGGVDGIGPDVKIGKNGRADSPGDDNNHNLANDKYRAYKRSKLLARIGLFVADRNAILYDQPDPYHGREHKPTVDIGSNSPRGT